MRRTQAERTAATRARLLEATVGCLCDLGHRGSSSAEVCRRAGVSRGAQLHHFPTKAALFAAAVEHLFAERIRGMEAALRATAPGGDRLDAVLDELWSIYSSPALMAWLELVVVARTDPELRERMAETHARLELAATAAFHDAMGMSERLPGRAIVRTAMAWMDGLAIHAFLQRDEAAIAESRAVLRALAAPWVERWTQA